MKKTDGVGATADASEEMSGEALFGGENLFACFATDAEVKIANHGRVRMRAENGAEEIVGVADVGDPVAHGFVDGVFESAAAGFDADDLRTEHAHARDIERLASHVLGAHVDGAFETE